MLGVIAGAWRALADERTDSAVSLRQTERVLAVRGAAAPAAAGARSRPRARGSRRALTAPTGARRAVARASAPEAARPPPRIAAT